MNWGNNRDKEFIEGEYEVLEERIIREDHNGNRGGFIRTNTKPPYVTYIILGINIVLYLLVSFLEYVLNLRGSAGLLYLGAKINGLIVNGQYWRLFTAMFLHVNLLHLFFNSYAIYIYGPIVEKLFGRIKFLLLYIISGLAGSLFSYILSPNPAVGASGAIFGLMGSLLYFRKENRSLFQRVFGPSLLMIIGINLVFGFVQPGIDNWGHIGGLVGGFLMGNALGLYRSGRKDYTKNLIFWGVVILIFYFGIIYGRLKYSAFIIMP